MPARGGSGEASQADEECVAPCAAFRAALLRAARWSLAAFHLPAAAVGSVPRPCSRLPYCPDRPLICATCLELGQEQLWTAR